MTSVGGGMRRQFSYFHQANPLPPLCVVRQSRSDLDAGAQSRSVGEGTVGRGTSAGNVVLVRAHGREGPVALEGRDSCRRVHPFPFNLPLFFTLSFIFPYTSPHLLPILSLSRINPGAHTQPDYIMQTLTNSFHRTSIRIRSAHSWEYIADRAYYAHRELPRYRSVHDTRFIRLHRRIKNTLCGSLTCQCGTVR